MEIPTKPLIGHYHLHGVAIEVTWDDPSVAEAVDLVLDYFGFTRSNNAPPSIQIRMAFLTHAPPSALPEHVQHVATHNEIDVWSAGDRLYFCEGATVAELHPVQGSGRATIQAPMRNEAGLLRPAFVNLVIHSLLILMRRHACYPLHAAGLAREGVGLLLVANSDNGKSTQALSLVHQGWQYLSDDSLLLRPTEAGVEALPLRREFGVDEDVAEQFPEIAVHWRSYLTRERKRRIDMTALYPEQALNACLPRILLFPEIVPKLQSQLIPISREEAMGDLLRQSPLLMVDAETAAAHIDVLERLVDQAAAYRLYAGKDLKANPSLISLLLASPLQALSVSHEV
jgi:hypothetical protein